jgi:type IV secretion system protein VirD4
MRYDELELDTLGDSKAAPFVIISDTDDTFNFVVAMMYAQLFNLLCDKPGDFVSRRQGKVHAERDFGGFRQGDDRPV